MRSGWKKTLQSGPVRLDVYDVSTGATYYHLFNNAGPGRATLLEIEILADGQRIDYVRLDRFWGHVPRPFLEFHDRLIG